MTQGAPIANRGFVINLRGLGRGPVAIRSVGGTGPQVGARAKHVSEVSSLQDSRSPSYTTNPQ